MLGRRWQLLPSAAVALAVYGGCGDEDPYVPPPNPCVPHLPANWTPEFKPPISPRPEACTAAQIDTEWASCEGVNATRTGCLRFRNDPANAVCEACMFSDGRDASYGPIILANGLWKTNTAGCIALLDGDTSAAGCAAKVQAASACYDEACSECQPYQTLVTCRQQALAGQCRPYYLDAVCSFRPEYARCTEYATSEEYFRSVARIFCWNGVPPRGIGTGEGAR